MLYKIVTLENTLDTITTKITYKHSLLIRRKLLYILETLLSDLSQITLIRMKKK